MSNSVTRQRVANINLLKYANKNRDQGFFNDVVLKTGKKRIPANRMVLSCYSTYLQGLFQLQERNFAKEYEIEIKDVNGKTLKALIDFIYAGFITINHQNVKDLLSGAHFLKLDEVKQFCFEFRQSHIATNNALDILKTAILYENADFQKETYQYISINLDEILNTDGFKALSNKELNSCISKLNRSQIYESSIFKAIVTWCNHDKEARKSDFLKLFEKIHFHKFSVDFLEGVVLEEELVRTVSGCHRIAVRSFRNLVENTNLKSRSSKLLCVGGMQKNTVTSKVTVVLELKNRSSSATYPDLPETIRSHCSLLQNDYIYCFGGDKKKDAFIKGTDSVWRLNSEKQTSRWEQVAPMNAKRCEMGAAVYCDVLVVAGGSNENNKNLASTEIYLPTSNIWNFISPLNQQRHGHALVSCDECLYVIGGWDGGNCLSSVERLGNLNEEWINIESMQTPRYSLAAVNCDGVVYAIGGRLGLENSTTLKSVEKYDSSANKWKYVRDMNFKRRDHAACVLRNKIYVVGGHDAVGNIVTKIECYDPMSDAWNILQRNASAVWHHTLVAV